MTHAARITTCLRNGASTVQVIAVALGAAEKIVDARLRELEQSGVVVRAGRIRDGAKWRNLWSMAGGL